MRNPDGLQVHLVFNLEASSSSEVISYATSFLWSMGTKLVRKRVVQGGLISAVVESWFPSDQNNYGMFLEDDIEVSPFTLLWVQQTLGLVRGGGVIVMMLCATHCPLTLPSNAAARRTMQDTWVPWATG
jgi:hypothetical protein